MSDASTQPGDEIRAFLHEVGLLSFGAEARFQPLTGGVSSDILLVEAQGKRFCVKRALAQLRVKAEWKAPVIRNQYEALWLDHVGQILPNAVPKLLAQDKQRGMLAMEFLPPQSFALWKTSLLAGTVHPPDAEAVGDALGQIHAAFTRSPEASALFDSGPIFHDIRLEPYLLATARVHSELAPQLEGLAARTSATRLSVVHGDISPKNILIGPNGPVFLDAECAWFGDPAFDLAFCLNHLLLKGIPVPGKAMALAQSFSRLVQAYRRHVDWEAIEGFEARVASLLPALLLARIDGKSPVEYITDPDSKNLVRHVAIPLISRPPTTPFDVQSAMTKAIMQTRRDHSS
jgi:tRNA A-37 threonylcarbamoyl transferase component Bud32